MKAQFVYESLDFERGLDPKEAMGIGMPNLKAVDPIINKVWTIEYKVVGKGLAKLIKYGREDPEGYENNDLPRGEVIEGPGRIAKQIRVYYKPGVSHIFKIVNPGYIFSYN
jgi:hypothetical protein